MIKSLWSIVKSSIFRRTIIYTASASLNSLIAFLLLPVLTKYLSPFDYGVVETFMAVVACLTGVVIVGGNTLTSKEYFVFEEFDRREFVGNVLGTILITSSTILVLYIFSTLWGDFFSNILKISNNLIILAIIVSCGQALMAMLSVTFQLEKKAISFAVFMNSRTFFEIGLSLFLIIGIGLAWEGRVLGIATSIILFGVIALYIFKSRNIYVHLPIKYGKKIILMGSPLILSHISGWVYGMTDKIMINNFVSVEATGLYSVGYRFGMVVMMVESAFSLAWLPFFYENIAKKKYENNVRIVKATYIYLTLLAIFSVTFGLLGKHLLYLMVDKKFFGADQFIFLISLAYFFSGVWKTFLGYIIFLGHMKTYMAITIFSAIIQITLSYQLLFYFGLIGAAWATCISMMTGALITMSVAIKSYNMPWKGVKFVEA